MNNSYEALAGRTMSPPEAPQERLHQKPHLIRFLLQLRNQVHQVAILSDTLKREIFYGQDKSLSATKTEVHITQVRANGLIARLGLQEVNLLHAAIGVVSEAGEYFDQFMGHIFDGKPLDVGNVIEETGDHLWYFAIPARIMGFTLQQCQEINISKLALRYGDKFSDVRAINRDLEAEGMVLNPDFTIAEHPGTKDAQDRAKDHEALIFLNSIIAADNKIEMREEDGMIVIDFNSTDGKYFNGCGADPTEALLEIKQQLDAPQEEPRKSYKSLVSELNEARSISAAFERDLQKANEEMATLRKKIQDAADVQAAQEENHQRRVHARSTSISLDGSEARTKAEAVAEDGEHPLLASGNAGEG